MESQGSDLIELQECKEFQRLLRVIRKKRVWYEQNGFCAERAQQKILEKILGTAFARQAHYLDASDQRDFALLKQSGVPERDILTMLHMRSAIQQYRQFGDLGEIADLFLFRLDRQTSPSDYSHCSENSDEELFRMNSLIQSELFREGPAAAAMRAHAQSAQSASSAPLLADSGQAPHAQQQPQQVTHGATHNQHNHQNHQQHHQENTKHSTNKRRSNVPIEDHHDDVPHQTQRRKKVKSDAPTNGAAQGQQQQDLPGSTHQKQAGGGGGGSSSRRH